ncbi:hypothetical protein ISS30_08280 [bacterium]|nr:hypothetical protein [bacterium]
MKQGKGSRDKNRLIYVSFPAGFKGTARNLPGICLPLYASCGGLKNGRNAIFPGFGKTCRGDPCGRPEKYFHAWWCAAGA